MDEDDSDADSDSESHESMEDCQSDSGLSQPELDGTAADGSKQQQQHVGTKHAGTKKAKQKQAGRHCWVTNIGLKGEGGHVQDCILQLLVVFTIRHSITVSQYHVLDHAAMYAKMLHCMITKCQQGPVVWSVTVAHVLYCHKSKFLVCSVSQNHEPQSHKCEHPSCLLELTDLLLQDW